MRRGGLSGFADGQARENQRRLRLEPAAPEEQEQRSASGRWPSTCSTCIPHPAQEALPHDLQVI